jgi:hypothetical protein
MARTFAAWCRLRHDDRVFRMDRISRAETAPSLPRPQRVIPQLAVDGHETKLPESALRPEDLLPNTDIGLSSGAETVGVTRRPRRVIRGTRR